MAVSNQQIEKLLTGRYTFANLSFSMLLVRMKMLYVKDPTQPTLQKCSKEIGEFLEKFKTNMGVDYAIIEAL